MVAINLFSFDTPLVFWIKENGLNLAICRLHNCSIPKYLTICMYFQEVIEDDGASEASASDVHVAALVSTTLHCFA